VPGSGLSPFVKKFGANVRRVRDRRDMTQEKLAELVDLNVRNIQRIEKGQIVALISTMKRIREALKCSWEDLLGR